MKFILNMILTLFILSIPTLATNQAWSIKQSSIRADEATSIITNALAANESPFTTSTQNSQSRADTSYIKNEMVIKNEIIPSLVKNASYSGSLDFCGSRIPIQIQDVRERIEREMLLILWDRAQVILWIKRASQYFPHIDRILKEYGLPLDLKYVAVIESGLRSQAGSNKGAMGTWQFMPSTGQEYGLRLDDNIDARKNLIESTRAACDYLRKLYTRFNSWPLALAAYNMGENGLAREMALQEVYDYYKLYLPQETQRYVLRVIVAREIMENPAKYGFYFSREDYYPVFNFAKVTIDCPIRIPITLIARAAKSYFKEIKDLNPEIKGYYLDRGRYSILIPPGMDRIFYQEFARELSKYQGGATQYQTTSPVQQGSSSILQGSSVSQGSSASQINSVNKGEALQQADKNKYHVVRNGDSLTEIAQRYGISFETLLKLNNFTKKSVIHPGQKLIVRP
ncbi:MAG: transglycosylase SLT domain-containing protein [Desulfamplus sp.]|nr:transglycosylase SLT domain-containing protein [Desulfamplus sp.]